MHAFKTQTGLVWIRRSQVCFWICIASFQVVTLPVRWTTRRQLYNFESRELLSAIKLLVSNWDWQQAYVASCRDDPGDGRDEAAVVAACPCRVHPPFAVGLLILRRHFLLTQRLILVEFLPRCFSAQCKSVHAVPIPRVYLQS